MNLSRINEVTDTFGAKIQIILLLFIYSWIFAPKFELKIPGSKFILIFATKIQIDFNLIFSVKIQISI